MKKKDSTRSPQFSQEQKMEGLGQLTGGIAHDFNNLLMIVQGNLDILRMDLAGREEHTQLIDHALEAAHGCADLIKKLMAFSRLQLLKPNLLKLQDIVPKLRKHFTAALHPTIELKFNIPDDLWVVYLDVSQFENTLLNLLKNASDAIQGKGEVVIEMKNISVAEGDVPAGDYVQISVLDTGCGILPENLSHVLEPFFTTKEVGRGLGLGLSMVYGFVKQSNGYIRINSMNGQGTVVSLYLPKAAKQTFLATEKSAHKIISTLRGSEVILLVEDQENLRKLTVKNLEDLGYSVLQARNAVDALQVLQEDASVQLLLTDIIMPGILSGPELVEKAAIFKPDLKIVYMSGYPQQILQSTHQVLSEKYPILLKPFSRSDLAMVLRDVLDPN